MVLEDKSVALQHDLEQYKSELDRKEKNCEKL